MSSVKILDLQDKVVVLKNWTLELKKVDSAEVFTSYNNLEVRLVVHSFKPNFSFIENNNNTQIVIIQKR